MGEFRGRPAGEIDAGSKPEGRHSAPRGQRVRVEGGMPRWGGHETNLYVRNFNLRHRRVGHLWQGRFKAILVEDGPYFQECSRYIHLNPNRAQLTRPAERYRWSSYRTYVGGPAPFDWVSTGPTLRAFAGSRDRYRAFVEAGKGEKPVSPFERAVAGLALGGEGFVKRILDRLKGVRAAADQPALRTLRRMGCARPEEVERAVEKTFAGEHPRRLARLRMYALRKHSHLRCVEVAKRCGRTPAAVSLAMRHLEEAAKRDRRLAGGLRELAALFVPSGD